MQPRTSTKASALVRLAAGLAAALGAAPCAERIDADVRGWEGGSVKPAAGDDPSSSATFG